MYIYTPRRVLFQLIFGTAVNRSIDSQGIASVASQDGKTRGQSKANSFEMKVKLIKMVSYKAGPPY